MSFALRKTLQLSSTKFSRVLCTTTQKFHTSKVVFNQEAKTEAKPDVNVDTAMTYRRKSKIPAFAEEYLPVFEFSKANFFRMCGGFVAAQSVFWVVDIGYIVQFSSDLSLTIPVLGLGLSVLATNALNKHARSTVTEIAVKGENDPVRIKTHTFFGGQRTLEVKREDLLGLPKYIDTSVLAGKSKSYAFRIRGEKGFMLMDKKGLFDLSGVLDNIVGYNLTSLERCPPSEPYEPRTMSPKSD